MDDSSESQNLQAENSQPQELQTQTLQSQQAKHLKSEKKILRISFIGSALFLLSECAAAFLTHSQAVLMDCVYDLVDLAMLGPFMILIPMLYKPVTEKWPYGLAQIESLFIIIKCGLLLFLDVQLMTDSIQLILDGGHIVNAGAIAAFELFVSASCVTMYFVLKHLNRGFSSPTVNAELYIWKLDAYSTAGVGLAFVVQLILQRTALAFIVPYIDPAIAIFMAAILLKEPVIMIWDALKSLALVAPKKVILEQVRELASQSLQKHEIEVKFLDMVKTGRKVWIDVYITQENDLISMRTLKLAHDEISRGLEGKYENISIELIPEI